MAIFKVVLSTENETDLERYVEADSKREAEQHTINGIVTATKLTDKEALDAVRGGAKIEVTGSDE